jgi:5-formyltetrahydrofolate cyclo-ligase
MDQKKIIRNQFIEKRNKLTSQERAYFSTLVCEQLTKLLERYKPKTIHSFIPFGPEINILPFLQSCIDLNISLIVPKINKKPIMLQVQIDHLDDLVVNKFGTQEPLSDLEFDGELDMIIVPGLAFTKNGFRIGYGGGYYDYFLTNQKNTPKIAVGYPLQLVEELPHEAHDIPVDMLILGDQVIETNNERAS